MAGHTISTKIYFMVFAALLVLTGVTTGVAYTDLGPFNLIVAICIALLKAMLVILFFMHVAYTSRLVKLYVMAGFAWLVLLLVGVLQDFLTRGWFAQR